MPSVEHQFYLRVLGLEKSQGRSSPLDQFEHDVFHILLFFAEHTEKVVEKLKSLRRGKFPQRALVAREPKNHRLREDSRLWQRLKHLVNKVRLVESKDKNTKPIFRISNIKYQI